MSGENKKQKWNGQCFIPRNMEAQRSKSHFWRKLTLFLSVPDNPAPKHHELITYLKCSDTPMFDAQQREGVGRQHLGCSKKKKKTLCKDQDLRNNKQKKDNIR